MFAKLFIRILAIFCMIGLGVLARKLNILNRETTGRMSKVAITFFYPALIFTSLFENFTIQELFANRGLPTGAFLIIITGYTLGLVASKLIKFSSEQEKNQFIFQSAINNYSFLPLPIVFMLLGNAGVAGLIFSTLGSEISVWTIGIFALNGNRFRKQNLRRLISMPMIALFAAIIAIALKNYTILPEESFFLKESGEALFATIDMLGKGTIPLAMIIAGGRIAELKPHNLFTRKLAYLTGLRLILIPAVAAIILHSIPFSTETRLILLVLATMPSAIASVMLSETYGSDTEFATACVLVTQAVSLITIPAWLAFFLR